MASTYSAGASDVDRHFTNLTQALRDIKSMRGTIGSDVPYAAFVHEGTRPHDIVPRNARALFWAGAAHPVARVHHPGTRPNPWLRQVFEARRGAIIKGIADGLEDAVRSGEFHASAGFAEAMEKTLELAQEQAPVRTGTLRASLHTDFFNR
jgi:hypothetical protein